MRKLLVQGCVLIAAMVLSSSFAHAQFEQQNRISRISNRGFRSTAQNILGRPTVSPYLALTDLTGSGQIDTSRNYFTQVRPRLELQRQNQQQQRQLANVQREVSAIRSAAVQRNQGPSRITGHPTRFNFLMHYYPGLARR